MGVISNSQLTSYSGTSNFGSIKLNIRSNNQASGALNKELKFYSDVRAVSIGLMFCAVWRIALRGFLSVGSYNAILSMCRIDRLNLSGEEFSAD